MVFSALVEMEVLPDGAHVWVRLALLLLLSCCSAFVFVCCCCYLLFYFVALLCSVCCVCVRACGVQGTNASVVQPAQVCVCLCLCMRVCVRLCKCVCCVCACVILFSLTCHLPSQLPHATLDNIQLPARQRA